MIPFTKDYTSNRTRTPLEKTRCDLLDSDTSVGSLSEWNPHAHYSEYSDFDLFNLNEGNEPSKTRILKKHQLSPEKKIRTENSRPIPSEPSVFYVRKNRIANKSNVTLMKSASDMITGTNKSDYSDVAEKLPVSPAKSKTKESLVKILATAHLEKRMTSNANGMNRKNTSEINKSWSISNNVSVFNENKESIALTITPLRAHQRSCFIESQSPAMKKNLLREMPSSSNRSCNDSFETHHTKLASLNNKNGLHMSQNEISFYIRRLSNKNKHMHQIDLEMKGVASQTSKISPGCSEQIEKTNHEPEDMIRPLLQGNRPLISDEIKKRLVLLKKESIEKEIKPNFQTLHQKDLPRPGILNSADFKTVFLSREPLKRKSQARPTGNFLTKTYHLSIPKSF